MPRHAEIDKLHRMGAKDRSAYEQLAANLVKEICAPAGCVYAGENPAKPGTYECGANLRVTDVVRHMTNEGCPRALVNGEYGFMFPEGKFRPNPLFRSK